MRVVEEWACSTRVPPPARPLLLVAALSAGCSRCGGHLRTNSVAATTMNMKMNSIRA